jgi:pullulanase-type alpha-1,6-glucosidase
MTTSCLTSVIFFDWIIPSRPAGLSEWQQWSLPVLSNKKRKRQESTLKPTHPIKLKYSAIAVAGVLLAGCNSSSTSTDTTSTDTQLPTVQDSQVRVFYKTDQAAQSVTGTAYDGMTLHVWNNSECNAYVGDDTAWDDGLKPEGVDSDKGAYWTLNVNKDDPTQCVNFIPHNGGDKPLGNDDPKIDLTQMGADNSVFTRTGVNQPMPELIENIPADTARIYFNTQDGDDNQFTLHIWNADGCSAYDGAGTAWPGIEPTKTGSIYGVYWDVPLTAATGCFSLIPTNKGAGGDYQTSDLKFEFSKVTDVGNVGFIFKGTNKIYYEPLKQQPVVKAALTGASAIFADDTTLLVSAADATEVSLHYAATSELTFDEKKQEIVGATETITSSDAAADTWKTAKPHLNQAKFNGFELDFTNAKVKLKDLLKGELIVTAKDSAGDIILATRVQPASALDALYATAAKDVVLGADTDGSNTTFRLWAPTAQSVKLIPYSSDKTAQDAVAMTFDTNTGVWATAETNLAHGQFYKYEVTVFHPATDKVETYQVTDPYSLSLATNSEYSQVVNLDSGELIPSGWNSLNAPQSQENPASFVIYEGHVRDFSALDASTDAAKRGKYAAFTQSDSVPVQHLKQLQQSGVTHLHLLPVFDIATIEEDPAKVADINQPFSKLCELNSSVESDESLGNYCSSSQTIAQVLETVKANDSKDNPIVQKLNGYVRGVDSFNWGYDPYHYTVPEGSYSSNADGMTRIKEFREMVTAVKSDIKMNVIMDVVYNHTNESGVSSKSVLDRIVPWYYQRLNPTTGAVEASTCCSNTAPENAMMAKLIKDSMVVWARDYKVDAFRWDLMGHHPKAQILETLAAVKAVDPNTYFYGEGWNFGEVGNDAMFEQATQLNMYGTGVGTFSDRMRDAVRGGGPFDGGDSIRNNQGFGNGAFVYPNSANAVSKETALHLMDLVRVGMAGNLKDYSFVDSKGNTIKGSELDYNGQPAGYAKDASEIQNYVAKHDNQTLWDNNQYKIPYAAPLDTRVRMQAVGLSTVMLGQGVVFTQMGSDLLRSKSMQRDSYDSGDWYNQVDFTMASSNWDKGLPRQDKDGSNYELITNVIDGSGDNAVITEAAINQMNSFFRELAAIRASSSLFALNDGSKINAQVKFHNTGTEQVAGLIVMSLDDTSADNTDVLVVINATNKEESHTFTEAAFTSGYALHTKHTELGSDSIASGANVAAGKFTVPAWSTAVFVKQ